MNTGFWMCLLVICVSFLCVFFTQWIFYLIFRHLYFSHVQCVHALLFFSLLKRPISLLIISTFSHVLFNTCILLISKSLSVTLQAPAHVFPPTPPLDYGSCFPFSRVEWVLILNQTDTESQSLHSELPQKQTELGTGRQEGGITWAWGSWL